MLDLDSAIAKLKHWAGSNPLIVRATVFGSYAKNTATPDSDLDIALYIMQAHRDENVDTTFICSSGHWTKELQELLGFEKVALSPEWDVGAYLNEGSIFVYERPVEEPSSDNLILEEE